MTYTQAQHELPATTTTTHCRCCEAAVERGDIPATHLDAPCPHPPCDWCQS